uniref:Uncharacterized protein n=1 Tax=Setaria digitata TaxID=48799 RepID=A0A915Q3V5_9BILA
MQLKMNNNDKELIEDDKLHMVKKLAEEEENLDSDGDWEKIVESPTNEAVVNTAEMTFKDAYPEEIHQSKNGSLIEPSLQNQMYFAMVKESYSVKERKEKLEESEKADFQPVLQISTTTTKSVVKYQWTESVRQEKATEQLQVESSCDLRMFQMQKHERENIQRLLCRQVKDVKFSPLGKITHRKNEDPEITVQHEILHEVDGTEILIQEKFAALQKADNAKLTVRKKASKHQEIVVTEILTQELRTSNESGTEESKNFNQIIDQIRCEDPFDRKFVKLVKNSANLLHPNPVSLVASGANITYDHIPEIQSGKEEERGREVHDVKIEQIEDPKSLKNEVKEFPADRKHSASSKIDEFLERSFKTMKDNLSVIKQWMNFCRNMKNNMQRKLEKVLDSWKALFLEIIEQCENGRNDGTDGTRDTQLLRHWLFISKIDVEQLKERSEKSVHKPGDGQSSRRGIALKEIEEIIKSGSEVERRLKETYEKKEIRDLEVRADNVISDSHVFSGHKLQTFPIPECFVTKQGAENTVIYLGEKNTDYKAKHVLKDYNILGQNEFGGREPTTQYEIPIEQEKSVGVLSSEATKERDVDREPVKALSGRGIKKEKIMVSLNGNETTSTEQVHFELPGLQKLKEFESKPRADVEPEENVAVKCGKETKILHCRTAGVCSNPLTSAFSQFSTYDAIIAKENCKTETMDSLEANKTSQLGFPSSDKKLSTAVRGIVTSSDLVVNGSEAHLQQITDLMNIVIKSNGVPNDFDLEAESTKSEIISSAVEGSKVSFIQNILEEQDALKKKKCDASITKIWTEKQGYEINKHKQSKKYFPEEVIPQETDEGQPRTTEDLKKAWTKLSTDTFLFQCLHEGHDIILSKELELELQERYKALPEKAEEKYIDHEILKESKAFSHLYRTEDLKKTEPKRFECASKNFLDEYSTMISKELTQEAELIFQIRKTYT